MRASSPSLASFSSSVGIFMCESWVLEGGFLEVSRTSTRTEELASLPSKDEESYGVSGGRKSVDFLVVHGSALPRHAKKRPLPGAPNVFAESGVGGRPEREQRNTLGEAGRWSGVDSPTLKSVFGGGGERNSEWRGKE
ncbi:hypothetical protein COLO4_06884 [Corchorus olitorius]|uniref:Uncharacterized protein n=1 Tax=Corchorus olitorius TaxID=93759 RepID=A0A1R3KLU4_9ROSI|nr:hypothetical protein COLO4_06884 [Corchorus olitorius]